MQTSGPEAHLSPPAWLVTRYPPWNCPCTLETLALILLLQLKARLARRVSICSTVSSDHVCSAVCFSSMSSLVLFWNDAYKGHSWQPTCSRLKACMNCCQYTFWFTSLWEGVPPWKSLLWFLWPGFSWTFHYSVTQPAFGIHWLCVHHPLPAGPDCCHVAVLGTELSSVSCSYAFWDQMKSTTVFLAYIWAFRSHKTWNYANVVPLKCLMQFNKLLQFLWCWVFWGWDIYIYLNFCYLSFALELIFIILKNSPTLFLSLSISGPLSVLFLR